MADTHEIPAFHPLHGDDQCRRAADAEARHDGARAAHASPASTRSSRCCRSCSARGCSSGLLMFVISMASHLYVLSKVELSFAYPFLSLAYVAVAVFAYFIFREDLNAWRIAGIAFICVGTVLIAQSGRGHERRGRRRRRHPPFIRARSFNETCDFRRRRLRRPPSCTEADRRRRRGRRRRHRHERPAALPHGALRQHCDVTDPASVDSGRASAPTTWSTICRPRCCRRSRCAPSATTSSGRSTIHGTENIIAAMDKAGAQRLVHFTTDMIYGHTVTHPMTEDHPVAPLGEYGWSKQKTEELAAEWRKRGMQHLAVPAAPDHRPRPPRHPGEAVQADRLEPAGADDRLGQEPLPVHLGVRLRRSGARRLQGRRAERGLQSRLAQPAAGQEAARRPDQACRLEIDADPDAGLGGQAHARPARLP